MYLFVFFNYFFSFQIPQNREIKIPRNATFGKKWNLWQKKKHLEKNETFGKNATFGKNVTFGKNGTFGKNTVEW